MKAREIIRNNKPFGHKRELRHWDFTNPRPYNSNKFNYGINKKDLKAMLVRDGKLKK